MHQGKDARASTIAEGTGSIDRSYRRVWIMGRTDRASERWTHSPLEKNGVDNVVGEPLSAHTHGPSVFWYGMRRDRASDMPNGVRSV